MTRLHTLLAALLLTASLAAAAHAQDEDLSDPSAIPATPKKKPRSSALQDAVAQDGDAPAAPTSKKPKPGAKPAKPGAKPSTKPSPKASPHAKPGTKPAKKPTSTAHLDPIPAGALESLDQALAAVLTEKHAQPVVAQEAPPEGPDLTVSIETLDQSLDAQLKKTARQPATTPGPRVTAGLTTVLDQLKERGGAGLALPHTASPHDQGPPIPDIPTQQPSPNASTPVEPSPDAVAALPSPATPESAPPSDPPEPARVPDAVATRAPELAPLTTPARRYVLTRIAISRDGSPEQDVPIPQGAAIRPIPLAHKGGNPPVEMKMLLRAPGEVSLGDSTQVVAQASAQAAGVAAELSLADEVVDSVRAADGADTTAAAGVVSFSFIKKVGGVYAYQQTFAQGDGRTPPATPPRSILLNWTDRDATLEIPFVWATTSPVVITLRGRLVYAPATRP